jgi:hypothetical protein
MGGSSLSAINFEELVESIESIESSWILVYYSLGNTKKIDKKDLSNSKSLIIYYRLLIAIFIAINFLSYY